MGVKDTDCYKNAMDGKCDVMQKFPHPICICSIDNHEAIAIIDWEQAFKHLYMDCPLKDVEEFELESDEVLLGSEY